MRRLRWANLTFFTVAKKRWDEKATRRAANARVYRGKTRDISRLPPARARREGKHGDGVILTLLQLLSCILNKPPLQRTKRQTRGFSFKAEKSRASELRQILVEHWTSHYFFSRSLVLSFSLLSPDTHAVHAQYSAWPKEKRGRQGRDITCARQPSRSRYYTRKKGAGRCITKTRVSHRACLESFLLVRATLAAFLSRMRFVPTNVCGNLWKHYIEYIVVLFVTYMKFGKIYSWLIFSTARYSNFILLLHNLKIKEFFERKIECLIVMLH